MREWDKETERMALRNDARSCLSIRDSLDAFSLEMTTVHQYGGTPSGKVTSRSRYRLRLLPTKKKKIREYRYVFEGSLFPSNDKCSLPILFNPVHIKYYIRISMLTLREHCTPKFQSLPFANYCFTICRSDLRVSMETNPLSLDPLTRAGSICN